MTTAIDVGQYIYDKIGWVDSWRLQKLTYYVHAWGLAWDGDPIFEGEFEAWKDGPVSRELYIANKYNPNGVVSAKLPGASVDSLSARQRVVIDRVLDFYGKWGKTRLIDQTHREEPWVEARHGLPDYVGCSEQLKTETIQSYYGRVAMSGVDCPPAPQPSAQEYSPEMYESALADETRKWADTLEWLATR